MSIITSCRQLPDALSPSNTRMKPIVRKNLTNSCPIPCFSFFVVACFASDCSVRESGAKSSSTIVCCTVASTGVEERDASSSANTDVVNKTANDNNRYFRFFIVLSN